MIHLFTQVIFSLGFSSSVGHAGSSGSTGGSIISGPLLSGPLL